MTHRQFCTWREWFLQDGNNPSRTDHYLMQVACEVRRSYIKDPAAVEPSNFRLTFKNEIKPRATREQAAQWSKAKWLGALGMRPDGTKAHDT